MKPDPLEVIAAELVQANEIAAKRLHVELESARLLARGVAVLENQERLGREVAEESTRRIEALFAKFTARAVPQVESIRGRQEAKQRQIVRQERRHLAELESGGN